MLDVFNLFYEYSSLNFTYFTLGKDLNTAITDKNILYINFMNEKCIYFRNHLTIFTIPSKALEMMFLNDS